MASNLRAMASNLKASDGLQPESDGLQPKSDGRQDIFASLYRCIGEFVFTQLDPPFACDDGCVIPGTFVDDGKCDCPGTCKDERDFTCDNCSCPEFCNQVLAPCVPVSKAHSCCLSGELSF